MLNVKYIETDGDRLIPPKVLFEETPKEASLRGQTANLFPENGDLQRERGAIRLGLQRQVGGRDSGSRDMNTQLMCMHKTSRNNLSPYM